MYNTMQCLHTETGWHWCW